MSSEADLCVTGGRALTADGWQMVDVSVENGRIRSLAGGTGRKLRIDGLQLVPGFIDLQINGGWGVDLQRRPDLLWELARRLPSVGVTSFLPTLTTNGSNLLESALESLRHVPPAGQLGAEPLGWHLEGPWLSPQRAGAHDEERLLAPPEEPPARVSRAHGVRLVTIAPELPGAEMLIEALVARGVVVSLGHSDADLAEARRALAAGATMGTHLFNAMSGLHHREPGLAAALLLGQPWIGLIADGHHVSGAVIDLVWRLASDRIVLVSDAVAAMGTSDLAVARLPDGTLAGSLVGLDACVRQVMIEAGATLAQAVGGATVSPAQCLGLSDRGVIEPGTRADLVALDDQQRVRLTIVGGCIAHDDR